MELAGRRVVVVGLARSGLASARWLARHGARVVGTDLRTVEQLGAEVSALEQAGVELELGEHRLASFTGAQTVVVSPGVPWDRPELAAARRAGAEVIAELELAFRHMPGRVAAVTGTKGKSTTTAALGAMLREAGLDTRVGGNIGEAATGLLDGATQRTVFALEVSSFQLEGADTFRPHVAVVLNLSADHLDRHPDLAAYAAAKARVFRNQSETDWAVVNGDDPAVVEMARSVRSRRLAFRPDSGAPEAGTDGAFFAGGEARVSLDGTTRTLFRVEDVRLPGRHLAADLLAAAAAAHLLGAPPAAISRAVARFQGSEHVLERVARLRGVTFFNDSKATNVAAARSSLQAFDTPLLLIAGGRYKGGDFAELRAPLAARGKAVFAIGEARERLREALSGTLPVVECRSLDEAVERAAAAAGPGDTVLLAPACSSFDMFASYAERGRAFKAAVERLREAGRRRRDGRG